MSNPTYPNTTPSFPEGGSQPPQTSISARYGPAQQIGGPVGAPPAILMPAGPPAPAGKSRRRLWITLAALTVLLGGLVGGGVGLVSAELGAPGNAATQFCGDLKAQNYHSAYSMLSAGMRAHLSEDQFLQDARALDAAEGKVKSCGQASGSGAYHYSLFASAATINLVIGRNAQRQGTVNLKSESGDWKIDAVATSLLGVNLGALQALRDFCASLQRQDYAGTYALLDSQMQAASTQDEFSQLAKDHDGIDGTVRACGLAGAGAGNSDSSARLTASITRSKLGQRHGTITLNVSGNAWKIASIEPALQGTDLGSVQVATQLCVDLAIGDFADAYTGLSSSEFQAAITQDQFNAFFELGAGESYTGCNLDLTTFALSGTTASFDVKFQIQVDATGQSGSVVATMTFVQENGAWKILRVETHG